MGIVTEDPATLNNNKSDSMSYWMSINLKTYMKGTYFWKNKESKLRKK